MVLYRGGKVRCCDVTTMILIGIVSYLHDADDAATADDDDGVGSPLSQSAARLGSGFDSPPLLICG